MKKKKVKKLHIGRLVVIFAILIAIVFGTLKLSHNLSSEKELEKTRLLFNNNFINLSSDIHIEDSVIYISEEDIKNIFDDTIYYNVGDQELITTYNKHVAVMHLNKDQMIINDSVTQTEGQLKEINSQIYLPINDLQIVYDIEAEYAEATNMVILDSTTKSKKQVMALKDTKIKKAKNLFSSTVEKVKTGDYLFVIEDDGKYQKVRTASGNIGYMKNKKVSDIEVLREDLNEFSTEINILQECSDIENLPANVELSKDKENVTIIDAFELVENNVINQYVDPNSDVYKNYYNWTTGKEINIIGKFKSSQSVSASFCTYAQRNGVINDLYNKVIVSKYKGVCIEFEKIDDVNSFYRFLIELTPKFKESGFKVIVKINEQLDMSKVKNIVDLTI